MVHPLSPYFREEDRQATKGGVARQHKGLTSLMKRGRVLEDNIFKEQLSLLHQELCETVVSLSR